MTKKMDIAESQFYTDSPSKTSDSKQLIDTITEGLLEKKARDI